MVFEKTLNDLVSGIRSHKRDTALFISQSIAEIKNELWVENNYYISWCTSFIFEEFDSIFAVVAAILQIDYWRLMLFMSLQFYS